MSSVFRLSGRASWAASFQYRDFRFLWLSTVVQSVAMSMEFVAVGWLVLELTGEPFWVGVASAARMVPFFFLGLVSGAVADRVDRRIFIRWVTLCGGGVAAVTALVLYLDYPHVWPIILLTGVMGCVSAFAMTLRQAYTYDIVGPQSALNGMSLSSLSQQVGGVPGSLIAGFVIALAGIANEYLLIGLMYVLSFAILMGTREAGQAAIRTTQSVMQNLMGYVKIISANRTLLALMILAGITELFGFTHQSLLPVFAKNVLDVGSVGLGIISALRQVGAVLGLFLIASLVNFKRKGLFVFIIAAAFGLGEMAFSLGGGFLFFIVVLAFINACAFSIDSLYRTMMQENVPNEQRGRAMGAWILSIGVAPVGHLGVGAMAGAFGAPVTLLINGAILLGVSISTGLGLPKIRRLP